MPLHRLIAMFLNPPPIFFSLTRVKILHFWCNLELEINTLKMFAGKNLKIKNKIPARLRSTQTYQVIH